MFEASIKIPVFVNWSDFVNWIKDNFYFSSFWLIMETKIIRSR